MLQMPVGRISGKLTDVADSTVSFPDYCRIHYLNEGVTKSSLAGPSIALHDLGVAIMIGVLPVQPDVFRALVVGTGSLVVGLTVGFVVFLCLREALVSVSLIVGRHYLGLGVCATEPAPVMGVELCVALLHGAQFSSG